jgi:pimeloyl-ACP methyl ester carboxylesterase
VVGHDLGGLLALACPPTVARAVVALAPLVPHAIGGTANPALSRWSARLAMFRSRPLRPPRGQLGVAYFAHTAPGGTTNDSARAARELCSDAVRLLAPGGRPTLLIAGERDPFCPPRAVERLALYLGAQCQTAERAGHALPWDFGWEQRAAGMHRWLIQALGEPLLLLRGDDDD